MKQLSLDVFYIRLFNLTLPEIAVFCGLLEGDGMHIIYKKLTRRD